MAYFRRIRELREDHDLTQKELAEKLGMKQPQYFRYEQGYRDIPLGEFFNVPLFNQLEQEIE